MPIPNRANATDYHYHAYMYPNDNGNGPWSLSPAQVNRNNYQFYSLREDLDGLHQTGLNNNVPNIALQSVGAPIAADGNNYDTLAIRFGDDGSVNNPPAVLLTGGIHAREWIAPEITYLIAEYLIMHYNPNPVGPYQTALSNLINTRRIYIAPMLNPAGNWYSVFSPNGDARMWRKNRHVLPKTQVGWQNVINHVPFQNFQNGLGLNRVRYDVPRFGTAPVNYDTITINFANALIGVDCNRNFNTPAWGNETAYNSEGQPTELSYFGTNHNSEVETQNLEALVNPLNTIAASIDYHSYSELIIIPTEAAVSHQHRNLGRALRALIELNGSPRYRLGTPMQTVGYHALSSVMDYMASVYQTRSFTIELDPAANDPHGFQLPETQIMAVFEKNIRGALALIATAGNKPTSSWGALFGCCCCSPWASSVSQFLTWDVVGRGNRLPQ